MERAPVKKRQSDILRAKPLRYARASATGSDSARPSLERIVMHRILVTMLRDMVLVRARLGPWSSKLVVGPPIGLCSRLLGADREVATVFNDSESLPRRP